jgi:O-antigen ligase
MSHPRSHNDLARHLNSPMATASSARAMAPFTRWAFYAWMFSLPFDVIVPSWLPMAFQGNISIPRMVGAALVLCFLIDPGVRPWRLPPALWAFAAFFGVFTLSMLRTDFTNYLVVLQQFQLLMAFFICYNLFVKDQATSGALYSYAISCGFASILILAGMAEGNRSERETEGREYAFGVDPNLYSMLLMVGALAAIGLAHIRWDKRALRLPILWGIALICVICIARSGSRGTSLALVIGILSFILRKGSFMVRLRNVILLAVVGSVAFWFLMHTEVLRERWIVAWETGSTSTRDTIYAAAWEMVQEKPVIGWGPKATLELANLTFAKGGNVRATHNMALAILTFAGFVGFLPYLWGYFTAALKSWQSRGGRENVLPLAIFAGIFVTDMVTGGLPGKLHWTFFAYMLAAGQLAVSAGKSRAAKGAAPSPLSRPQALRG